MIDDITIALKVSGLGMHPIEHMMQLDPVRNRPLAWRHFQSGHG